MKIGHVRKIYPGANSSGGFFSFYDQVIEPDCTRILVIKGGPGVGKSSLMKSIGSVMLEKGLDIEHHCCSSDNESIDGVVIPAIGVALLDGTAPHVVDPKNPGVVDEIIHLGDHWNETKLVSSKAEVIRCNRQVGRFFAIAYSRLREAKVAHDEWESYITESMNWPAVNKVAQEIEELLFDGVIANYQQEPKVRHLFANAITPGGLVNYVPTLLDGYNHSYVINGNPGTGKSTILARILEKTKALGLDCEVFHCPFDPKKIDLILIKKLKSALIADSELLQLDLSKSTPYQCTFNLNDLIKRKNLELWAPDVASAKERFWNVLNEAIKAIGKAKSCHDELENYYIPHMDFNAINARRDRIRERILEYAKEQKVL
ncbi:hypothetical protein F9B85_07980 [Heliorestis acidaminivorans]|uniref:ATPase n=1 Tax=Heliorestis acidaminivorans TaxID=553427 RepID=A0A6I0F2A0_9FIRM|nr:PRK06851 family protein [Heliorestis acidaminivorans]KAB2952593.1 hypothetical protein F9B85_07980 [Heliorestis acidaminivorans]